MDAKSLNQAGNDNLQQVDVKGSFNYQDAWLLLEEKGLRLNEIMKIRKAFEKIDENIEYDYKNKVYSSKKKKGYTFEKEEELKLLNALIDFSPNSDTEKIIQVMSIVMKLLDFKSEWSFRGSR